MDVTLVKQFAELKRQEADLRGQLETVEKARKLLEQQVIDAYAEAGVQKLTVDGATVYLRRDVYPSYPQGKDAAVAILQANPETAPLVQQTFNHQQLCALLREREGNYPPEWAGVLEIADVYRVGLRNTGGE